MSIRTRLETLAHAFWAHLREYPLPEPCRVSLDPGGVQVDVQVSPSTAVQHLGELLLWAYTLNGVTAHWWHTESGDLHIGIDGCAAGRVRFHVYGGISWTACAGLVRLEVGESEGVSVDELYTLRDLLTDAAAVVA